MAKITIFGLAGTGTSSTGIRLAHDIGYEYISPSSVFRKKAAELGLDVYQFDVLCSTDPKYDREIDEEMKVYGETHNDFIAESRLSWFFVPDSFKIKLVCDFDERINRVALRDKISFEEAQKKTLFREQLHEKRFADYYGIKEFAPDRLFDAVIDTTTTPLHKVLETIKHSLRV